MTDTTTKTTKPDTAAPPSKPKSRMPELVRQLDEKDRAHLNAMHADIAAMLNKHHASLEDALNVFLWQIAKILYDHPLDGEEPAEAIKVRLAVVLRALEQREKKGRVPLA